MGLESTSELLDLARGGDRAALEALCHRYIPRLTRWASGRLPGHARHLLETDDLVQDVFIRTIRNVQGLDARSSGQLHSYLRTALTNRIRDEIRRTARLDETNQSADLESPAPSPVEALIGREDAARYEAALARLKPEEQEAIVARLEMGCTYPEIAEALGKPSPDAARMAVTRAIVRLTEEIRRG